MQQPNTSIAESSVSSTVGISADGDVRIADWVRRLREAPMTDEHRPLFEAAARELSGLAPEIVSADRTMCLLLISRHAYFSGNAYSGLDTANEAVGYAKAIGDPLLLAKALNTLGSLYLEAGSYPDTVSTLSAAIEAARAAQSQEIENSALSNLGLAHQYAGHYSAAIPCYERVVAQIHPDSKHSVFRSAALANLALAHLQLREFQRGLEAAEESITGLAEPKDVQARSTRSFAECYYARLLVEVRNLPMARERVALAREFAVNANELSKLTADMTQGLVDIYDPATRDIGLTRLQGAVDQCRKGAQSALRDALSMIVRGYEVAGQPNAALVYLDEVVQLNGNSRVRSVLTDHHRHLAKVSRDPDLRARAVISEQREALRFQRLSMDVLRECMLVLEKNTVAAELHDDDTGEHCYRVGALAKELALKGGMDSEMCTLVDLSARLHDIGKLRVPDSILLKPGRLNAEERTIMEAHCRHGWELIGDGGLAQLFVAQEIALNHHERWDGSGYPNRRAGNMIPLAARVTALADVYDALTHRRCYKDAWSEEDALREIARLRGTHFDPELTDLFLVLVPELRAQHGNLDAYLGKEARRNDFITDRARVARELKSDQGTFDARR